MVKVTIECTHEQLAALRDACELAFRVALGQFGEIAHAHADNLMGKEKAFWDVRTEVERACKAILTPDMPHDGMSYGVGNPKVSKKSHVQYAWWKLFGGGTQSTNPLTGKPWILNYTGETLPDVTIVESD